MGTSVEEETVRPSLRWNVADVTLTVVIAVASGIIFWGIGLISEPISAALKLIPVPGVSALYYGLFYFAGPLAAIMVRKPGAALFGEFIAAMVELTVGSHWGGIGTVLPGFVQGLFAEFAFLFVMYRKWNVGLTALSGALAGLGGIVSTYPSYYAGVPIFGAFMMIHTLCSMISGAVIGGVVMWYLYKGIAATGALSRFASGKEVRA